MSEERETEQAGAAVEPAEITESQVQAAVERAAGVAPAGLAADSAPTTNGGAGAPAAAAAPPETPGATPAQQAGAAGQAAGVEAGPVGDRVAPVVEPPSAGAGATPAEIFGASNAGAAAAGAAVGATAATPAAPAAPAAPLGAPGAPGAPSMPGAPAQAPVQPGQPWQPAPQGAPQPVTQGAPLIEPAHPTTPTPLPPARDGEIRINADHPMAALYMQSPMPPDPKGNRGAGVLISLLATLAFALVYAGVIALWMAPDLPPSRFLSDGMLPWLMSWSFIASVLGFFVALALLVLIVGRAGWWAYVLGGLLVAAIVWAASLGGFALDIYFAGGSITSNPLQIVQDFGLFLPVIAAAIVAREVTVWFGAWIGSRGRKVTRQNAEALTEYEAALAEVQGK